MILNWINSDLILIFWGFMCMLVYEFVLLLVIEVLYYMYGWCVIKEFSRYMR